jgi:hypothetical protein
MGVQRVLCEVRRLGGRGEEGQRMTIDIWRAAEAKVRVCERWALDYARGMARERRSGHDRRCGDSTILVPTNVLREALRRLKEEEK